MHETALRMVDRDFEAWSKVGVKKTTWAIFPCYRLYALKAFSCTKIARLTSLGRPLKRALKKIESVASDDKRENASTAQRDVVWLSIAQDWPSHDKPRMAFLCA